jgi:hypothetical protein
VGHHGAEACNQVKSHMFSSFDPVNESPQCLATIPLAQKKFTLTVSTPAPLHSTQCEILKYIEPFSKRFSLVKIKAGDHFNRRNTMSISRIEM